MRFALRIAAALCAILAAAACAQRSGPAPSNCTGVFRATVESGQRHPRYDECADRMVPEIVSVVRDAPRRSDPQYLARVLHFARPYRSPDLARAALALAGDRSAPGSSQMLGWLLGVSQLERSLYLRSLGRLPVAEWFTSTATGNCDWAGPTDVHYYKDAGLPPGYRDRLGQAANEAAEDAARPQQVRAFARCAWMLVRAMSAGTDSTDTEGVEGPRR